MKVIHRIKEILPSSSANRKKAELYGRRQSQPEFWRLLYGDLRLYPRKGQLKSLARDLLTEPFVAVYDGKVTVECKPTSFKKTIRAYAARDSTWVVRVDGVALKSGLSAHEALTDTKIQVALAYEQAQRESRLPRSVLTAA